MAKHQVKKIAPALCVQSLQGFNEAVGGLMNIMDELITYVKETPTDNQPLKDFYIKHLTNHTENIKSFQVYE